MTSSVSSEYSSKKAAIISLFEKGYSNKEIAARTNTTKAYVAKLRSLRKSEQNSIGRLASSTAEDFSEIYPDELNKENTTKYPKISSGDASKNRESTDGETESMRVTPKKHNSSKMVLPLGALGVGHSLGNNTQGWRYNDPVGKEIRITLWKAFDAKVSLVEIIKEHGYMPEMVEQEYSKFLRAKGFRPTEMQGVIIRRINASREVFSKTLSKEKVVEYDKIVQWYNTNGTVTTEQFSTLIDLYRQIEFFNGKKSILNNDIAEQLFGGWVRPICYECHKPLPGIIYDASRSGMEYIGQVLQAAKTWVHYNSCQSE